MISLGTCLALQVRNAPVHFLYRMLYLFPTLWGRASTLSRQQTSLSALKQGPWFRVHQVLPLLGLANTRCAWSRPSSPGVGRILSWTILPLTSFILRFLQFCPSITSNPGLIDFHLVGPAHSVNNGTKPPSPRPHCKNNGNPPPSSYDKPRPWAPSSAIRRLGTTKQKNQFCFSSRFHFGPV